MTAPFVSAATSATARSYSSMTPSAVSGANRAMQTQARFSGQRCTSSMLRTANSTAKKSDESDSVRRAKTSAVCTTR